MLIIVIIIILIGTSGFCALDILNANSMRLFVNREHEGRPQDAPRFPEQFSMNWTIYKVPSFEPQPPYKDDIIPPPYCAGRGNTYYDWTKKAMREIYHDFCVPIFPNGTHWPCQFLNVDGIAYLISSGTWPFAPCCILRKPFYPPSPDFIKSIPYNKTTTYKGKFVDWYILHDPDSGPFGYGWFRDRLPGGERRPGFFWFPVNQGFSSQTFFNVNVGTPPSAIFDVPEECQNAKSCDFP